MFLQFVLVIVKLAFNIIAYFAWIRFLLEWGRAPIHNIFTQQIIKISNPITKSFGRLVGSIKNYNIGLLIFLLLLNIAEIVLFIWITTHSFPDVGGLLLWAVINMIFQATQIIFYGVILYAIMSWFPSLVQSPLGQCIIAIIDPIVSLFRRFIPTVGIFDFSALAVLLTIYVLRYFILSPLLLKAITLSLA